MPEPGKTGFSLVVSRAGDWTIKMIANPPTHIWKRGIPTYGVMKIAPMFRRLVVVATGSGIGPCTAAIMEKKVPIRVLWTAPSVRGTFGDKLVDSILEANPESVVYDTRQHGKPDMVKLTYRLVQEFKAEAVVIISNQKLTEKVVYGMPTWSDLRKHNTLDTGLSGALAGGALRGWKAGPRAILPGALTIGAACTLLQLAFNEAAITRVKYISGLSVSAPVKPATPPSKPLFERFLGMFGLQPVTDEQYVEKLKATRDGHLKRIAELEQQIETEKAGGVGKKDP
ncbi:hypothetical protein DXG03_001919 [Asterophora parasitica]|uniref:Uncharacterized protein n=1 Tax=Asterophora parasitica TaxID=117018 RepID=A0A9P7G8Z5_9AGAR|nr:hypothetical protein DXG03_001919 [Asterophora parasitica]